ncbi:unnamed protein product [Bursaphelenchus xylophilus]|uniref:(pine wood nematode) hypothetical protein n=1 Tax=Bursaphelenchus xylophilus TaxID=6326 RepID=A0A7I8WQ47_BURXY|nr:unnamed protein product [Bursaphelenchus xylophilus]CAG9095747.1 unnamed protein product [Bursaphelenchus xylophilus]
MSTISSEMELHFGPTKENPYCWDFADNKTGLPTEPYDELGRISRFLRISYCFESTVGGALSFTMLYLVLYRSTGQLKAYSKMLLLCTLTDLSYWATDNFIQVKSKLTDGVFLVKVEGPASYLSYNGQVVAMSVYVVCLSLIHSILPAQYYFRYCTVLKGRPLSSKQTLFAYAISLGMAIPMGFIAYPAYGISGLERPGFNYGTLYYREVPMPQVLIADIRSVYHKCYFLYASLLVPGGYVVAMIYAYKTVLHLKANSHLYSEKTRAMQAQLSRALLFQSVIPLFVSVLPITSICIPSFFYVDTGISALVFMHIASWVPIFNPLLTIAAIVPYRRAVLGFILNTKIHSSSMVDTSKQQEEDRTINII